MALLATVLKELGTETTAGVHHIIDFVERVATTYDFRF